MPPPAWPPRFTLDTPSVLHLLTGDRFYSAADAALREALLNAIDARGRRVATDPGAPQAIELDFDGPSLAITLIDNGDGMSADDVTELFARVGASASKLAKTSASPGYRGVGEFGIGVVSYFLACDQFELHSLKPGADPIALRFTSAMLDGDTTAELLPRARSTQGTTLVLRCKSETLFDRLRTQFPHWARSVQALSASYASTAGERTSLSQGGTTRAIRPIPMPPTAWVEQAELGPPVDLSVWDALDGRARVDVLYRGIFVQHIDIPPLWGLEGALHVDPRQFRPKLNRESFIAEGFIEEISRLLQRVHPTALLEAARSFRDAAAAGRLDSWTFNKWATIWLAVPRGDQYAAATAEWDSVFRTQKTFRLLSAHDESVVSLDDIQRLNAPEIFVAPVNLSQVDPIQRRAVAILRARRAIVVQGLAREESLFPHASFYAASTADLLLSQFRKQLPALTVVETKASEIVRDQSTVLSLFDNLASVQLVKLGDGSEPVMRVGREVWINVDHRMGKQIVRDVCDRNEGLIGLLVAVHSAAPQFTAEVLQVFPADKTALPRMGPVRRHFLRSVT